LGIVEGVQQKGEIIAHRGILGCAAGPGKPSFALADESLVDDDRLVTPYRHRPVALQGICRWPGAEKFR
jgi:hypothetical protein